MTEILILLALTALLAGVARYARHDHFAGPGNVAEKHDDLGSLALRGRVV